MPGNGDTVRFAVILTTMRHSAHPVVRDVPVTSTIVESNRSLIIIDTGMADNPDLLDRLTALGHAPADFDLVINTHLHPDHIGGNRLFTKARILISRREFLHRQTTGHSVAPGRRRPIVTRMLQALLARYPVADVVGPPERLEFLEDNPVLPAGIGIIPAPGHSIDSHAVVLRGDTRQALATGDALYHRDLWRQHTLPGIHYDEGEFRRRAEDLAAFAGIIIPGHDRAFDNATGEYLEPDTFIDL